VESSPPILSLLRSSVQQLCVSLAKVQLPSCVLFASCLFHPNLGFNVNQVDVGRLSTPGDQRRTSTHVSEVYFRVSASASASASA
jgi:hypothetical protein